jgi:DNA-binding helix-hairpin-helix protein with protein kinase domain
MVETDISQLSGECNTWRAALRTHRDEFGQLKNQLQDVARNLHQQESLKEVEHFHNQFHIQLINIHDLKQSVKTHERQVALESAEGRLSDATYAHHESLHEEYQGLERTLADLKNDFDGFIRQNQ